AEDLVNIFGKRQWKSRTEEIMRLQAERDAKRELEEAKKAEEDKKSADGHLSDKTLSDDVVDVTATVVEAAESVPSAESTDKDAEKKEDSTPTPPPFKG
ncbi:MAG: hypothetical protein K2K65_08150, partial [Duncaniella sp.]|nr:hypothetical protein [Duncaniella sp.]